MPTCRAHAQAGADRLLKDEFDGQVSVHTTNQAVDAVSTNDDLLSHILRTIAPSSNAVALEAYKVVVSTGALSGNSIKLTLCRYETSKNECARTRAPPPPSPPPPRGPATCEDNNVDCPYWKDQRFCEPSSIYAP